MKKYSKPFWIARDDTKKGVYNFSFVKMPISGNGIYRKWDRYDNGEYFKRHYGFTLKKGQQIKVRIVEA